MPIVYPGFRSFDDGGLRTNMHSSIYIYGYTWIYMDIHEYTKKNLGGEFVQGEGRQISNLPEFAVGRLALVEEFQ